MESSEEVKRSKSIDLQKEENVQSAYSLEVPLEKSVISRIIKALRSLRDYSQTRLGRILGVQKTQVSKLENGESNLTIGTMMRVFSALKAKVTFKVKVEGPKEIEILKKAVIDEKVNHDSN